MYRYAVATRHWLWALLTLDTIFIAISLVRSAGGPLTSPMFSLSEDGGYSEFYQYAKWAGIAAFMFAIARWRQSRGFHVWGLFALFLLADDALKIHERTGDLLHALRPFAPPFGLRLEDVGELALSATAGLVFLMLIGRAYRRAGTDFRLATHDFAVLVGLLAAVGVGIDMLHVALNPGQMWNAPLTVLEDGGEMVIASVMCWYAGMIAQGSAAAGAAQSEVTRLRPAIEVALGKVA